MDEFTRGPQRWGASFLALARFCAEHWSKDPSTRCGAVLVRGKRIVSLGVNGFPQGVRDDARLHDRKLKYEMIVHAEANVLLMARQDISDCVLYTWPIPPCSRCAGLIIQAGVRRVVNPSTPEHWAHSCGLASDMFREAGVEQHVVVEEGS